MSKKCISPVQFLDDESLKNLISGCPVLKQLILEREDWDNAETLYICSSTLDDLLLYTDPYNKEFGYRVVIDAPSLRSLSITDYANDDYDLKNLSSLKSAFLDITRNFTISPNFDAFSHRLFALLKKISHVADPCLVSGTMRVSLLLFVVFRTFFVIGLIIADLALNFLLAVPREYISDKSAQF